MRPPVPPCFARSGFPEALADSGGVVVLVLMPWCLAFGHLVAEPQDDVDRRTNLELLINFVDACSEAFGLSSLSGGNATDQLPITEGRANECRIRCQ